MRDTILAVVYVITISVSLVYVVLSGGSSPTGPSHGYENAQYTALNSSDIIDSRPDEASWLVLDQVYQVWFRHEGPVSELEQMKLVLLSLAEQKYKVKSVTITSFAPRQKRALEAQVIETWQVPNTAIITLEK